MLAEAAAVVAVAVGFVQKVDTTSAAVVAVDAAGSESHAVSALGCQVSISKANTPGIVVVRVGLLVHDG